MGAGSRLVSLPGSGLPLPCGDGAAAESMKSPKVKKDKAERPEYEETEKTYEELVANVNAIAQPLASRKLSKKLYKCVKKAAKVKQIRRGVKEVQKFINKGEKGIVLLAGDTLPIDVYSHLPILCEDKNLPYVYIPSKMDLGASAGSKRPTCVILIKPHEDYQEAYSECLDEVQSLNLPL
ncbi:H/ACA ribonucleoprotein complex subunit 2-like protein [Chiloscyllium punctatum]|uniref:H/ACA ribonucleoprotein complex subunit 2-like protein n=1 Tax=Chiloscyllium punctatum TaxID=137246 RepID=UPI003B63C04A